MRQAVSRGHAAVFAPLHDGALRSEAVVQRLAGAIALGLLDDGEQLPSEIELATSLRVAVVTLREALADLRSRGLLETRRGRGGGSFVRVSEEALAELARRRSAELGTTDLRELGETHAAVAGAAARLAAERATVHDRQRLAATLAGFASAERPADRRRIDGRLHIEIAAAAQSTRLTRQEVRIQTELAELQLVPGDPDRWATDTLTTHRAVLDAIGDHDGAAARAIAEEHIGRRTRAMIDGHIARLGAAVVRPDGNPVVAALTPVTHLVDRVFGAVDRLRDCVVGASIDAARLQAGVRDLLAENRDIVVGMGMIVAPARRRVLWWQDLGGPEPTALQVDLNPHSLGFYDYGVAGWFSVPRASGGRYVDGPYVDVHGTDRYLLTFTMPVVADGDFVGIVGADVPVTRFETHLLRAWGGLDAELVIVNADDRVVVSNTARALPGDRHPLAGPSIRVPSVGWRLSALSG